MANHTNDKKDLLGKSIAIGQIGGLIGIGYAFYAKTGFWKGVGLYIVGSFAGSLAGAAYYNFKK